MKKLLTLICLAFFGTSVSAQIFYHDINPDTTMGGGPALKYFVVTPPSSAEFHVFWGTAPSVYMEVHGSFGNGELLYNGSWPAKLETGNTISSAGTWLESPGILNNTTDGHWQTNAADKYIGFRFKKTGGGSGWYYGWLKMTVAPGAASFTVKAWAYKNQAGQAIAAGDMSSTSVTSMSYDNSVGMMMADKKVRFSNLRTGVQYTVAIVDISGRMVQKTTVTGSEVVDLAPLTPGIYAVRLSGAGNEYRFKTALL